jgi:glycosyltransferase involved in cell wall biosynthesis
MNTPLISICIPTYKRTHLLKTLLESIKIQTFRNFEILINDNSPDDSVEVLVNSYKKDLPVSYERNEPAVNAGDNFIKVMQRARAEWVKIMHDDDWFASENALQLFADAALHSGKDFIFSASMQVWLDSNKTQPDELTPEHKQMLDESRFCLFYLNVIGHPSVALHRKDSSIEYDSNFNWVLDIDYYMRYLGKHSGYHYLPEKLINIGKGATQESNKYYKNIKVELPEYFYLLAKYDRDLCLKNIHVFHLIWNMLKRYKIKHVDQIYASGYKGPMPDRIEQIIAYQQYIPRLIIKQTPWSKSLMKKCYNKVAKDYAALNK